MTGEGELPAGREVNITLVVFADAPDFFKGGVEEYLDFPVINAVENAPVPASSQYGITPGNEEGDDMAVFRGKYLHSLASRGDLIHTAAVPHSTNNITGIVFL